MDSPVSAVIAKMVMEEVEKKGLSHFTDKTLFLETICR